MVDADLNGTADQIAGFLADLENAMGRERFNDRSQLFRTAHGLYAVATLLHDAMVLRKTSIKNVVEGITTTDWTWNNADFQRNIGQLKTDKKTGRQKMVLNTGQGSINWMVGYLRNRCGVLMPVAA